MAQAALEGKPDFSALEKGMKLQALCPAVGDGKWYQATVVEVSKAKKRAKAPIKAPERGPADADRKRAGSENLTDAEGLQGGVVVVSLLGVARSTTAGTATTRTRGWARTRSAPSCSRPGWGWLGRGWAVAGRI